MSDNTTGLTTERFERIKLALSDYGGLTREEGMLLVRELSQLERERDEARVARDLWESRWNREDGYRIDAERRAEKAEAALERVTSDEFKQKITKCIPREHRGYGTSREILALIRNETDTKETP